ncbi:MAG: EAL domain-containing protein [Candidatus Thiodiazotropha sp.]|jgi:diguanylate cyclase (GGDEF)-like protein/PAS domain S-box-containing protein
MKSIKQAVLDKQIDLLYSQSGIVVQSGVGMAFLAGLYYWLVNGSSWLIVWMSTLVLVNVGRLYLFYRFGQIVQDNARLGYWLRRHLLTTFLSGLIWGLLSLFYDPNWPTAHQVVLFMLLAGLAAWSVSAYSAVLEVYVVFLIPLLLPLEISLLVHGDQPSSLLGGLLLIFAIGMLFIARKFHSQLIETIHLSFEHQFLQQAVSTGSQQLQVTEHALRATEQQFDHVLESSLDGFWEWDTVNKQIYLSPRWKEQLGFDNDELPNELATWQDRLHPEDRPSMMQKLRAYLEKPWGSWEEEYRMQHKSGEYRWILARATPSLNEQGKLIRLTGVHIDITERVFAESKARKLAYYDWLTELPNRILFNDRITHAISQSRRSALKLYILFFDLDRFKNINDSFGHPAGDSVLKMVAERLVAAISEGDTLARLGGDEFAILIENVHHSHSAVLSIEKVQACFEKPFIVNGHDFYLSASIGISVFPDDGVDAAELLKNADVAMYQAKNTERGGFQFYTQELSDFAFQHFTLESGLRQAMKNREFQVYYQPKLNLLSGRISGIEALVRWRHPKNGLISPELFIPVAEETGQIKEVGEWVLEQACRDALAWTSMGYNFGRIAVNLSGVQIQSESFLDTIKRILSSTGMDMSLLELEITENILMRDTDASVRYLAELQNCGISISIDDFGTGYSSLAQLARFPVDKLKIDRSFVQNICHDKQNAEISRTIIALGKTLNKIVIAEGIEDSEQFEFLRREGCDEGQGFLISRPVPQDNLQNFLMQYQQGFPLTVIQAD